MAERFHNVKFHPEVTFRSYGVK